MKKNQKKTSTSSVKKLATDLYPMYIPLNAPQFIIDWAKENNASGEYSVSFINGKYYVYRRKGHIYIGALKEDGIHASKAAQSQSAKEINLELSSSPICVTETIQVNEYGFSRAVIELCPEIFKTYFGNEWKAQLAKMVLSVSPGSYLSHSNPKAKPRYGARTLFEHYSGILVYELYKTLGTIQVIRQGDSVQVSMLSDAQKAYCREHHITLGLDMDFSIPQEVSVV